MEKDPILYALHKHVHLIVILPFDGHVWEIDGLEAQGPLHLGACGHDLITTALPRLQEWSKTELMMDVHVNIQAIIHKTKYTLTSHMKLCVKKIAQTVPQRHLSLTMLTLAVECYTRDNWLEAAKRSL